MLNDNRITYYRKAFYFESISLYLILKGSGKSWTEPKTAFFHENQTETDQRSVKTLQHWYKDVQKVTK